MKHRIICLFLALFVLLIAFSACTNKKTPDTESTAETTAVNPLDEKLGFQQTDYEAYEFRMLVPLDSQFEHYATDLNGSAVNDEVYRRNKATEDFFNIDITVVPKPATWDDRTEYLEEVTNSVISGTKNYDAVVGIIGVMSTSFKTANWKNVATMEGIDLSQSWWVNNQFDQLSVNGKLLCVIGDMNLTTYGNMYAFLYNTRILANNGIEDNLYELVNDHEWTLEALTTLSKKVSNDLNNNSIIDLDTDSIGIICQTNASRGFMTGFDLEIFDRDESGTPYIVTTASEKYITAYTSISNLLNKENWNYKTPSVEEVITTFTNYHALFAPYYLKTIEDTRVIEIQKDIGVVPYPLYDTNQKQYITSLTPSVTCFPSNVTNPTLSAQVSTYMAYYGQTQLAPKYFEAYLQIRLSSSPEMAEMLSLLRQTATITFTIAYSSQFSPVLLKLFEVSTSNDYGDGITTTYKSNTRVYAREWNTKILPLYNDPKSAEND